MPLAFAAGGALTLVRSRARACCGPWLRFDRTRHRCPPACSPSVCVPKFVPCRRGWRCVSTSLSNRAKPFRVCGIGKPWHGFHGAARSSCPGRIAFRGPPRCVAARIAAQGKRRVRLAPARDPAAAPGTGGRVRRSPRRGCGPAARAQPRSSGRPTRACGLQKLA